MEAVWQDFRDRGLVVLGADCWNGTAFAVSTFIDATGVTFPMLLDAGVLQSTYGINYDNYIVIDPEGIVRYTSVHESLPRVGNWNDAAVRAVVTEWLPTGVAQRSWGAVKQLFRD